MPATTASVFTDRRATATAQDYAALLLRVALGLMFLAHGLMKFVTFTLAGTAGFFESIGFPGWAAYVVAPAEVLAGIALIAGFRTRLIALLTVPILFGTIVAHAGAGWVFSNPGGGWEYPLFLLATTLAVALQGGGRLAVSPPNA